MKEASVVLIFAALILIALVPLKSMHEKIPALRGRVQPGAIPQSES